MNTNEELMRLEIMMRELDIELNSDLYKGQDWKAEKQAIAMMEYARMLKERLKPDEKCICLGSVVRKKTGSQWSGKVVGFYRTELTPYGVCVESDVHKGSVQIYPLHALELCNV